MVRQEIYGYLIARYAVCALICRAATETGIDPDRVTLRITAGRNLNTRRERSYPRVVKRARHNSYPVTGFERQTTDVHHPPRPLDHPDYSGDL